MSLCLSAFHYARVQRGAKIGNGRELVVIGTTRAWAGLAGDSPSSQVSAYFTTYITSFTAFTTRGTLGREASINVGVNASGTSA